MVRGPRLKTSQRRAAGPPHPLRAYPIDERRELPARAQQGKDSLPGFGRPGRLIDPTRTAPLTHVHCRRCDTSHEQLAGTLSLDINTTMAPYLAAIDTLLPPSENFANCRSSE